MRAEGRDRCVVNLVNLRTTRLHRIAAGEEPDRESPANEPAEAISEADK